MSLSESQKPTQLSGSTLSLVIPGIGADDLFSEQHLRGNFRDYYSFHSVESRLSLIPNGLFLSLFASLGSPDVFSILDCGCNDGSLSMAVFERAKEELPSNIVVKLVGVDIDNVLINRAKEQFSSTTTNVEFKCFDFMVEQEDEIDMKSKFSFVCCFSSTMWIHLHYGDEGLNKFLRKLSSMTHGAILLEPQNWDSYKTARKRIRKQKLLSPEYLGKLAIKDCSEHIRNMNLGSSEHFCHLGVESWKGRHLIYITLLRNV